MHLFDMIYSILDQGYALEEYTVFDGFVRIIQLLSRFLFKRPWINDWLSNILKSMSKASINLSLSAFFKGSNMVLLFCTLKLYSSAASLFILKLMK